MPHPTDVHVGKRVREARASRGMSQSTLAEKLGISFQQVQKYEKGTNRIGGSRLWDICAITETPITYFFEGLEGGSTGDQGPHLARRTIKLAKEIEQIQDEGLKDKILDVIRAASRMSA
jgi:transcriptional regulator with XRE-family HTH domain